ncbi:hypothetical protein RxyAA322_04620 [Rubrobacter xylanophilus]|uniref:DUF72 domain-containing protein n=1 Tax=Rubrobacter xylanophilus TaxID=49319 RepID=A0A510HF96_9ACTN|nr:DUF72 domain-containing protein [Rubrobacter xylanophilus]BBL78608.1 hypothetical protein RxyAA322_04620 [Rubrobacter xylanophilus]
MPGGGVSQQPLFGEEEAGRVFPPEPGLYLGTSGWSYADWEGSLYHAGLAPRARLAEYARHYATVEIDSTFYGTPRRSTVERWRAVAPEGFLFAAKFPREITHERRLAGVEREAERFVETMALLGERLGPLLVQLPPSFDVGGMGVLEDFLSSLPGGFRYAVEVRHRSWLRSGLPGLLRERGVALALADHPGMPRMQEATASFVYVRWIGDRREFPSGHTAPRKDRREDLRWWAERVRRFLDEGREVFAYANNHYQNHSPSTLRQFLEVYREMGEE